MIIFALLFFVLTTILYLPVFFFLKKRGVELLRQLSYLLFAWSFLIVVYMTIFSIPPITFSPERYYLNLRPFAWLEGGNIGEFEFLESIGNVLMLMPLGALLPVVIKGVRKFWMTVGLIFIIGFSIEFIQYFIGRVADIDDLIEYVVGGALGYGWFSFFHWLLKSKTGWLKFIGSTK